MCNLKKHKQEHEDPLADCIGEKKPEYPAFAITIGLCSLKIAYKRSKEHSEVLITHREVPNAVAYAIDQFSKVLEGIDR